MAGLSAVNDPGGNRLLAPDRGPGLARPTPAGLPGAPPVCPAEIGCGRSATTVGGVRCGPGGRGRVGVAARGRVRWPSRPGPLRGCDLAPGAGADRATPRDGAASRAARLGPLASWWTTSTSSHPPATRRPKSAVGSPGDPRERRGRQPDPQWPHRCGLLAGTRTPVRQRLRKDVNQQFVHHGAVVGSLACRGGGNR